jgi:HemY protein
MRRLIIFLAFLIISVWLGIVVMRHPGYLLVVSQPWLVQMPLWFAILSLIICFSLFYFLVSGVDRLNFLWFRMKNWLHIRREHKSYSKTQHGLAALIEGRWKKSEQLLLAGMNQSFEPFINYLAAAKAAQELGAFERRDKYIREAYLAAPKSDLAIGLTQAELELKQDQLEQAAATLNRLRQISPRHPRVLKMLEKVYVRLGDWKNLQSLIPNMRKARLLNGEQSEQFEKNLYCELLRSARYKSLAEIKQIWHEIPRNMRKNPDVACEYVKQLMRFPDTKEIEEVIHKTLKQHWQPELVKIYGNLPFANINRQLVIAGAWLKIYGQRQELLLLLAKLCVRVQLWGKARDYFEKCLALGPNAEASLEYGKLLTQLGENEEAMRKYQDGLVQLCSAPL